MHQSVSITALGYLTAALIAVTVAAAAVLVLTIRPAVVHLLQHADMNAAWAELSADQQVMAQSMSLALGAVGALALLFFSVFVGLTTHNAPGLGANQPMLSPNRAATCWAGALWAQARIAVGMIVPGVICWEGYALPGMIAAIVALEIAHRHLDDAGGWLDRPSRHLPDLYAKLGLEGSGNSPVASIWSVCFRLANLTAIAVYAIPALAVAVSAAATMAGRSDIVTWQSTGLGAAQMTVALLVISLVGWTALATALLVPITLGLVQRQRTRKTLVRVGRARSWIARPGEGAYTAAAGAAATAHYEGFDDEDRIVERRPGIGQVPEPDAGGSSFGRSSFGRSSFGGPSQGGRSSGGPAQSGSGLIGGSGQSGSGLIGGPSQGGPSFGGSGVIGGRRPTGSGFGGPSQGGSGQGRPS
ncbi:MAG: hypothetical protein ABSB75_01410 [Candidatus Limnocylindrales bacterium]